MSGSRHWPVLLLALVAPAFAAGPSYLGPASCSSVSCHGSATPRTEFKVAQNEYRLWAGMDGKHHDKHSRAYAVLSEPLGQRIARNLNLGKATEAKLCLACHEPIVPPAQKSEKFATGEGVSCEHCHGPSSGWIDTHAKRASHADNVARGLVDLKDSAKRAAQCLQCHLGAADRRVDHGLIAAGHPDLTFELDTFTAAMPPHFKVEREPSAHLKAWALGQAQQLKSQMDYLATITHDGPWPDYARLDCAGCHHPITLPSAQWRLKQDKHGRMPGRPPFNTAQHAALHHLARAIAPSSARPLQLAVDGVTATLSTPSPGRRATAVAAQRASGQAARLVDSVRSTKFDAEFARKLVLEIARDAKTIADQGPRAGLQTLWLLDLLLRVPQQGLGGSIPKEVEGIMSDLYRQADHMSEYNAPQFATQLQRLVSWAEHVATKPQH